jgi:hypothetical protein
MYSFNTSKLNVIIIPYIILNIKVVRQFGCFMVGDNPLHNPNKYNVEGNNRLLPSLQHLTIESVLKIHFVFQSGSIIVFSIPISISVISWQSVLLVDVNWGVRRKPPTYHKSLTNFIT